MLKLIVKSKEGAVTCGLNNSAMFCTGPNWRNEFRDGAPILVVFVI